MEKYKVLKEMSPDLLEKRVKAAKEALYRLRAAHAANPLPNPMKIRMQRREIARLQTARSVAQA